MDPLVGGFAWQARAIVKDLDGERVVDVRFGWQAWRSGCTLTLLDVGGSAWQAMSSCLVLFVVSLALAPRRKVCIACAFGFVGSVLFSPLVLLSSLLPASVTTGASWPLTEPVHQGNCACLKSQ